MLLTIERIHNSLEKQHTENRSLLVATGGKDLTVVSPVGKDLTVVSPVGKISHGIISWKSDQNKEDDIHGL